MDLLEILKRCTKGTKLYSPICGELEFLYIEHGQIICSHNSVYLVFDKEGRYRLYDEGGECLLFPSKDERDWNTFKLPINDGTIVAAESDETGGPHQVFIVKEIISDDEAFCYGGYDFSDDSVYVAGRWAFDRIATDEEIEKFFKAMETKGFVWNVETKTLDRLNGYKFKVGDKIRNKTSLKEFEIQEIKWDRYILKNYNYIAIGDEDCYELVIDKFDISKLIPFESRVLVRDEENENWRPGIWGYYDKDNTFGPYILVGGVDFERCIPLEGNEHLLGTSEDADEYYKTWG